jgi:hypothetical protein
MREIIYLTPPIVSVIGTALWWADHRKRSLLSPEEIIRALYPAQCDGIAKFLAPTHFEQVADDASLYSSGGGWQGMLRMRRNAGLLVQLAQHILTSDNQDPDAIADLRYMTQRAMFISFLCYAALPEAGMRWIAEDLPHWCAQLVYQIYWQMERRTHTLCGATRPDLLEELRRVI